MTLRMLALLTHHENCTCDQCFETTSTLFFEADRIDNTCLSKIEQTNSNTSPNDTMPRQVAPPPSGEFTVKLQKPFQGKPQRIEHSTARSKVLTLRPQAPRPTKSKSSASPTGPPSCVEATTAAATSRTRRRATCLRESFHCSTYHRPTDYPTY